MTDKGGEDAARPRRNSPPPRRRPAGDVAGVSVPRPPDDPRPVTVEVAGRRCLYELAWDVIDGQPAVTDLRVVPRDGEPVTQTDLRINLARIAAVVASRDTAHAREVWSGVADAFADAAERSGLPRTGFEWWASIRPDAHDLYRVWQAHRSLKENDPAGKRRPGRPKLPDEHYVAVAALAKRLRKTKTRSLYQDFQDAWAAATGGDPPAIPTVRDWIAEAKRRNLLAQDELKRPPTIEGNNR